MSPTRSRSAAAAPESFLRSLFLGELRADLLVPYPARPAEERESTDAMVEAVTSFARERIDAREIDRRAEIPRAVLDGLAELGLFGMLVPAEHGGLGLTHTAYCRVLQALASHCTASAATVGAHQSIGLKAILLFGTDAQKAKWLPRLASGEQLAAFALTEPGAGSDVQAIATIADPLPDGSWRLRGSKLWITNGGIAGLFTVFAKTPDPQSPGERKLTCFLVPRDAPGVSIGKEEDKMGLKGSSTTAVYLEDVVVRDEDRIGEMGRGFKIAVEVLNGGRHGLAAGCLGLGRAALEEAVAHAKARQQFGKPIVEFALVAELLANAEADLYAIESGCYWVAGKLDAGARDVALESAACKIFATESLWRIVNDCLQVAGGSGFMREFAHERRVRDARVNLIFEGTNQILRLFLALQGLRGPGEELKEVGDALKHPLAGVSVLGRFAGKRMRRSLAPPKWTGVPPELRSETALAAESARALGAAAEELVRRHGRKVIDEQLALAPLADAAAHLFLMGTILARAIGEPEGERLGASARLALRRLYRRFRDSLDAAQSTDRDLIDAVAERWRAR